MNGGEHHGALEALLATPAFKDLLRGTLESDGAGRVERDDARVRRLVFADVDTTVSLIASLPGRFNQLVVDLAEVGRQLAEKSTPQLTQSVLESLLTEVDVDALRDCWSVWSTHAAETLDRSPAARSRVEEALVDVASRVLSAALNDVARYIVIGRSGSSTMTGRVIEATDRKLDKELWARAGQTIVDKVIGGELDIRGRATRLVKGSLARRRWRGR